MTYILLYIIIIGLGIYAFFTGMGLTAKNKLAGHGVMALSIAFIVFHVMTASSTTETKSWQTLYRNDIKADITLENGHYIAMTPNDITSRADVDKLLTRITLVNLFSDRDDPKSPATITVRAKNDTGTATRVAELYPEDVIEKWPKGQHPNRNKGKVISIKYQPATTTDKLLGLSIGTRSTPKLQITIQYEGTKVAPPDKLFRD